MTAIISNSVLKHYPYVIVRAHKLEIASRAFIIQEMK